MDTYISENQTIIIDSETFSLADKQKFPIIDSFHLEDIFFLNEITGKYREKHFDHYSFHGMGVPRVTHILEDCIEKSSLMYWAAYIGKEEMVRIQNESLTIGSVVHEMIENYLLTGEDLNISKRIISKNCINQIYTSYSNFKSWILYINAHNYFIEEIIAIECPIVCTLYGGTIDCIMKINGKVYIVDFKTSKSIKYEYILQVCSYYWAVNSGYCFELPHIDGVGIVRIDKKKKIFEDLFLNEQIPYQREILNNYVIGWGTILSCYYNKLNLKCIFDKYIKQYKNERMIIDDGKCN